MAQEDEHGIDRPTENWTRFPNCILDNLQDIDGSELKVLALMIRKTLGWRDKANKRFAAKYVAAKVGVSERTAWSALLGLQERGLIRCIGKEWHGLKLYEVNWNKPKQKVKIDPQKLRSKNRPVKSAVLPPQNLPTVLETNHKETSNAGALHMIPKLKESKTSKRKEVSRESLELAKPIYAILEASVYKVERSKTLTEKIAKTVRLLGIETVRKGTLARIEYMRKAGKDLYFHSFIEDDEAVTWQASKYKDPSSGWNSPQARDESPADLSGLQKTLAVL